MPYRQYTVFSHKEEIPKEYHKVSNTYNDSRSTEACFVILHYGAISDTICCIKSILCLENSFSAKIVVVNNGMDLQEEKNEVFFHLLKNNRNIFLINLEHNIGFAKANNIGFQFCVEKFNPNYVVVTNNDIEFYNKDFIYQIDCLFKEYDYSLLGPDIINISSNRHQNPLRVSGFNLSSILYNIFIRELVILSIKSKIFSSLKNIFHRLKKNTAHNINVKDTNHNTDYAATHFNCVLYGACLIFSKKFIQNHSLSFYPNTFMYVEEDFLWHLLIKNKETVLYSPNIIVHHETNSSTIVSHPIDSERTLFKESSAVKSFIHLLKYILSGAKDFQKYLTR